MIAYLVVLSFAAGAVAPLITTVAFVLQFSFVAATAIAILAFYFDAGIWTIVTVWISTIVAMQFGFALSMLATTVLNNRRRQQTESESKPIGGARLRDRPVERALRKDR